MSEADKNLHCSFCGKNAQEVKKLIAGPNVYICDECVDLCYSILSTEAGGKSQTSTPAGATDLGEIPSPSKIKEFMDQYIIGQDYAKMVVAVAVHNHYLRLAHPVVDDVEIDKSNILVYGPTGSGKTLIAQTIARVLNVPFAMADATSLTEAGYVGDDVESIVGKLLASAGGDVAKCERGIIYLDEIDKKQKKEGGSGNKDVSGEGVQQALLKILEGSEVMVPAGGGKKSPQAELVKVNTKNILFIVGGAFVGLEKVVEKSLNKNAGLGFNGQLADKNKHINDILRHAQPEHLVQFGIIPELIGRLPVAAPLEELAEEQLVRVLTEPKNAVIKQFIKLFQLEGVILEFTPEALLEVAKTAKARKTGARGLRSVIENKLIRTQFNLPELKAQGATKIVVTKETVTDDQEPTVIFGENNQGVV
jgi:ATP-dependent Clp protease ATP-binding subunit ClpX